jgi:sugar-specific transcriptional regulator TrmB
LPAKVDFSIACYSVGWRGRLHSVAGMMHAQRTRTEPDRADISARIAVYPPGADPEITEIAAADPRSAAAKFTRSVMGKVRELGGGIPEEAVREVVENLIHAEYRGVIVSVLDGGNVVRVSDRGPGIQNKERAVEFGFSGASSAALEEIRGIGAGLGMARSAAEKAGGSLTVEDNIGGGTVTTISVGEASPSQVDEPRAPRPAARKYPDGVPRMNISERQQKVLITVLECGEVGPSTVAERLEISVSTAYRDLSVLEEHGLVQAHESGKRLISPLGKDVVEAIVSAWVK